MLGSSWAAMPWKQLTWAPTLVNLVRTGRRPEQVAVPQSPGSLGCARAFRPLGGGDTWRARLELLMVLSNAPQMPI